MLATYKAKTDVDRFTESRQLFNYILNEIRIFQTVRWSFLSILDIYVIFPYMQTPVLTLTGNIHESYFRETFSHCYYIFFNLYVKKLFFNDDFY